MASTQMHALIADKAYAYLNQQTTPLMDGDAPTTNDSSNTSCLIGSLSALQGRNDELGTARQLFVHRMLRLR